MTPSATMPRFSGDYKETFTLNVPIEAAKQHFGDPDTIIKHQTGLKSHDKVDDKTIHYVLIPRSEKGVTFNGEYTVRYEFTSDDVFEWKSIGDGNLWSTGKIKFKDLGGRTQIDYWQSMECEMKVNRLLAKMIKPIVSREIAKGTKDYLDRMRASLRA